MKITGVRVRIAMLAGETLHVVQTLAGSGGTITLAAQGVVRWTSPTTATFFAGHWRVVSGTGAYADLKGAGTLAGPDRRTSLRGPSTSYTKARLRPTDVPRKGVRASALASAGTRWAIKELPGTLVSLSGR